MSNYCIWNQFSQKNFSKNSVLLCYHVHIQYLKNYSKHKCSFLNRQNEYQYMFNVQALSEEVKFWTIMHSKTH
jgi:hypothetical protein